jgi:hypothetical protein
MGSISKRRPSRKHILLIVITSIFVTGRVLSWFTPGALAVWLACSEAGGSGIRRSVRQGFLNFLRHFSGIFLAILTSPTPPADQEGKQVSVSGKVGSQNHATRPK